MPITCIERILSGDYTLSDDASTILRYVIEGTTSESVAMLKMTQTMPILNKDLLPRELHIEPTEKIDMFYGEVIYGQRKRNETGDHTITFDTTGGTQHIDHTLETVGKYKPTGEDEVDNYGLIGNTGETVEGVDITTPTFRWTETHYLPLEVVTDAYVDTIYALTGRTNNDTFRRKDAGEVLFEGATGSQRSEEDWEITFYFAASPNVTDLSIGSITGIEKKGWEYLWVLKEQTTSGNKLVATPRMVYVEKVYYEGDFGGLGIGT